MPVYRYQDVIADSGTGRPVPNATVTVTQYPSGAATVYNDSMAVVASVQTGSTGRFSFYVDPGRYNILVNGVVQLQDVSIGETVGVVEGGMTPVYSDATSAPQTVNLPSSGEVVVIKTDDSANAVTIVPSSGKTVMWQSSVDITVKDEAYHLLLNGTNWYRI